LRVQRQWTLALTGTGAGANTTESIATQPDRAPDGTIDGLRSRLPVHIEDSEWSRLALGIAADAMTSLGVTKSPEVVQLDPDSVTVHLPSSQEPSWPFEHGRFQRSWSLPRDSDIIASLQATPALTGAAAKAALVTLSVTHGRRTLVDLVAAGSTVIKGAAPEVGVKLAEIAVELASRRWSDLESLILVAFDGPMPRLAGTTQARYLGEALEEVTVRAISSRSTCVIVPPWAADTSDPLLGELLHFCEETDGIGLLFSASTQKARCVWDLGRGETDRPRLNFADGRQFTGADISDLAEPPTEPTARLRRPVQAPTPSPLAPPVEIGLLGNVQVDGAPESFRYRRRLTELVAFLAMHPEGATTDSFATALWPERRVPVQTLANRLSETRRALGIAGDGRPRLRKAGRRHFIADAETDWDRFKKLSRVEEGAESWRKALALVRGRPFDGLERGEWAQLEGFASAVEAAIVDVACRLGEHALDHGEAGITHWAALQGLLASPWDERLYRLLMRASDGLGNRGGVDVALRSLAVALELEGDPLLGIHPETSALYRRLTSRSRT
jgi:DNA-binding SARP family transcriptional activator